MAKNLIIGFSNDPFSEYQQLRKIIFAIGFYSICNKNNFRASFYKICMKNLKRRLSFYKSGIQKTDHLRVLNLLNTVYLKNLANLYNNYSLGNNYNFSITIVVRVIVIKINLSNLKCYKNQHFHFKMCSYIHFFFKL